MSKFCDNCCNLLTFDNGKFQCSVCQLFYKITPEQSLMVDDGVIDPQHQYTMLVYGAPYDPVNKLSNKYCEDCKQYKRILHLGSEEKTIMVCRCGYRS